MVDIEVHVYSLSSLANMYIYPYYKKTGRRQIHVQSNAAYNMINSVLTCINYRRSNGVLSPPLLFSSHAAIL
jgi:hypothetical protein